MSLLGWALVHATFAITQLVLMVTALEEADIHRVAFSAFFLGVNLTFVGGNLFIWLMRRVPKGR